MRILTIGGYGYDQIKFVDALAAANVDTFVDVRQRRGLRGRKYAFLNSSRLQKLLHEHHIRYVYLPELAPTTSIRDIQKTDDERLNVRKRERMELSPDFIAAYKAQVLGSFDFGKFINAVGVDAKAVVIFCVEGEPSACHRSLVAEYVAAQLGTSVEHIRP